MTEKELYEIYASWSGKLHFYIEKHLNSHLDVEFFPATWRFALYSGHAQEKSLQVWNFSTVPALSRPPGEAKEIIQLPTPQDNPSQEELDAAFKDLCLAAARVLEIDLGKPKLEAPAPEKSMLILRNKRKKTK